MWQKISVNWTAVHFQPSLTLVKLEESGTYKSGIKCQSFYLAFLDKFDNVKTKIRKHSLQNNLSVNN